MNRADVHDEARNVRSRRLRYGIATSFLSRGAAAAGPILIIPIIWPYLGPTLFGVWATALAVSAVIAWSDLGLGSSLVTRLTVALDRRDEEEAHLLVANAYAAVGVVALVLVTVPWASA